MARSGSRPRATRSIAASRLYWASAGVADGGQGVQVGDEVELAVAVALQVNVLPDGPKIVSPMETAGRLDSGKHSHGEGSGFRVQGSGFRHRPQAARLNGFQPQNVSIFIPSHLHTFALRAS